MGGAVDVRRPAPCGPYCGTTTGHRNYGCRCLAAYDAVNEGRNMRRRAAREGTWRPYVDARPCRLHLRKLRGWGMTYGMIAGQTFIRPSHLWRIDRGVIGKVRPATAELILTTGFAMAASDDTAEVPPVGAQRRIQALQLAGWTFRALDRRLDLRGVYTHRVLSQSSIRWGTHTAVASLASSLDGVDPVAAGVRMGQWKRTVAGAVARGWVPLSAWVQDIDDPRSEPYKAVVHRRVQQAPAGSRRLEIVEETAHLASYGFPPERIAEVLGVEWASVLVAHQRAGVPVPGRLVA